MDYEKLDEFVTLVTETVPDLLDTKQRAKLLLRLRTRVRECGFQHCLGEINKINENNTIHSEVMCTHFKMFALT